jgi:hypothetical protein
MATSGDSSDAVVYGHEDAAVRVQDRLHGLVVDTCREPAHRINIIKYVRMYVCVYVCVHLLWNTVCVHVCIGCMYLLFVCMYAYIYYGILYACMYVCICMHTFIMK